MSKEEHFDSFLFVVISSDNVALHNDAVEAALRESVAASDAGPSVRSRFWGGRDAKSNIGENDGVRQP